MIKIGTEVVCIKNCIVENKVLFVSGIIYKTTDSETYEQCELVKIENTIGNSLFFSLTDVSSYYFYNYFKTRAEFRDTRINEIFI